MQDTPAVGFAYGLERLIDELTAHSPNGVHKTVRALVVPIDDTNNLAAAHIANQLRTLWPGQPVELFTPPTRILSQALTYADRQAIPYVFIVGADEWQEGAVILRIMDSRTQQSIPLDKLRDVIATLPR